MLFANSNYKIDSYDKIQVILYSTCELQIIDTLNNEGCFSPDNLATKNKIQFCLKDKTVLQAGHEIFHELKKYWQMTEIGFYFLIYTKKSNYKNKIEVGGSDLTNSIYFEGEGVDSIDHTKKWYLINEQKEIKRCNPKIEFIKFEEHDIQRKVLSVNEASILIFNTNKELSLKDNSIQNLEKEQIEIGSKISISKNFILYAKTKMDGEDEILSLEIKDKKKKKSYEVFRNCRAITNIDSYYGCGRLPFQIEYIGDIINDKKPEIIISAEKEGSILKFVLGFKDDKYKVLKWTEFE